MPRSYSNFGTAIEDCLLILTTVPDPLEKVVVLHRLFLELLEPKAEVLHVGHCRQVPEIVALEAGIFEEELNIIETTVRPDQNLVFVEIIVSSDEHGVDICLQRSGCRLCVNAAVATVHADGTPPLCFQRRGRCDSVHTHMHRRSADTVLISPPASEKSSTGLQYLVSAACGI